jgi:hypothetical protein
VHTVQVVVIVVVFNLVPYGKLGSGMFHFISTEWHMLLFTYVHRGIRALRRGSVERLLKQMGGRRVWWETGCVFRITLLCLQVYFGTTP